MKRIVFVSFFLFLVFLVKSQDSKLMFFDSLSQKAYFDHDFDEQSLFLEKIKKLHVLANSNHSKSVYQLNLALNYALQSKVGKAIDTYTAVSVNSLPEKYKIDRYYFVLADLYAKQNVYDTSLLYYELALNSNAIKDSSFYFQVQLEKAGVYLILKNPEIANQILVDYKKSSYQTKSFSNTAKFHLVQANLYISKENFKKAMQSLYQALHVYKLLKEEYKVVVLYNKIGGLYGRLSDIKNAKECIDKAIVLAIKNKYKEKEIVAKYNLANIYSSLGKLDTANALNYEVYQYLQSYKADIGIKEVTVGMGTVFAQKGDFKQAEKYFLETLAIGSSTRYSISDGVAAMNLGMLYSINNSFDKSVFFYLKAEHIFKQLSKNRYLSEVYYSLSKLYENKSLYDKAVFYNNKFLELDKLFNKERNKVEIQKIKLEYEAKITEQELKNKSLRIRYLEEKSKVNNRKNWIITLCFLLGFLLIVLLAASQRIKLIKKEKIIYDIADKIEKERALYKEQQFKIEQLKLNVEEHKEVIDKYENHLIKSSLNQEKSLSGMIKQGLKTENDWTVFMTEFYIQYKGFYSTITDNYKGLSKNDLKIVALLKLNLSISEMALVMNITPASVKKARNRLRDKLSLDSETTLNSFIDSIS